MTEIPIDITEIPLTEPSVSREIYPAVDLGIAELISLANQGYFVIPFYTQDVEDIPDFSEGIHRHVSDPVYVGHLSDPDKAIEDIMEGL